MNARPLDLTEADLRDLRGQGDLREFLRELHADALDRNQRNRRLVLAHPDLAEQLTQPPLALAHPDCWTGYIPPDHQPTGLWNRSPVREQLAALVAEAEQRATRPAAAATPGGANDGA